MTYNVFGGTLNLAQSVDNTRRRDAQWKASHGQVCYQTHCNANAVGSYIWKHLSVVVSSTLTVMQRHINIRRMSDIRHRFIDRECEILGWAKTAVQVLV